MTDAENPDRSPIEDSPTAGVHLSGRLICKTPEEAETVREQLPLHILLTRAEPGCESFDVSPTADPLVWLVKEHFSDVDAFQAHQARIATSEWGRATAEIERQYETQWLNP